ncbi:MAG: GGDEF domain-containing protein [Thermoleophilia bacterium]|jgi:diguanylate cyclase (GGDEF)-like protein|nr:GGDEF domain-containing protein [Thermoleophilia bacterium]
MAERAPVPVDAREPRFTVRRAVLLAATLGIASAVVALTGVTYLWPLAVFPLVLAAVFFFELGGLLVTLWAGNVLVLHYSFAASASPAAVRDALIGSALFFAAGLLLGAVQRRHHRRQRALAASSLTDRLTGLYNYGTFVDALHNEARKVDRYGGQLTLLMLDLDHFKRFNDCHGHEAGNEVLRSVGALLRASVRDADLAARYGGEEFAVLIRGDEHQGYELAERLRHAVERTGIDLRRGTETGVTVSVGVAGATLRPVDETALVERADEALYAAKARGRNRVVVATGVAATDAAAVTAAALSA